MMARFQNDIDEVIACLKNTSNLVPSDSGCALENMIASVDEEFLNDRALAFSAAAVSNEEFSNEIKRLNSICKTGACSDCPVRKYCNYYISELRSNDDAFSYTMVDLFCGAGGLSLGFTQKGFRTVLANDIEECCVDTYAHNHPETPRDHIIRGDIRNVVNNLDELLPDKNVDIVVGGPPCQGFSMANRQRLIDDPRNYLYKNYVAVVNHLKPKFFIMENVKGMLSVAEQVKDDFKSIGYSVECHVLNARDFGVPQNRERLIYIGNRLGIDNSLIFSRLAELAADIPAHTLADALIGLRPLVASRIKNATGEGSEASGYIIDHKRNNFSNDYVQSINNGNDIGLVFNHKARYNNDRDIEIFSRLYQGDRSDDPKIADIMPYKRRNGIFKDKYFKLEEQKICKTITAHMKFDCNMYIHPTQARGLTPREAARIQSYPDDYFFRGAYTKTYMQIGNSVPPLLGKAIATVIRDILDETKID